MNTFQKYQTYPGVSEEYWYPTHIHIIRYGYGSSMDVSMLLCPLKFYWSTLRLLNKCLFDIEDPNYVGNLSFFI